MISCTAALLLVFAALACDKNSGGQEVKDAAENGESNSVSDTVPDSGTDVDDAGDAGGDRPDVPARNLPSIDADEFSIVVLPDTQSYVALDRSVMAAQTAWIADNVAALGIEFVAHVGDVVMSWDEDPDEWAFARECMGDLDRAAVPYGLLPGNHDYAVGERDSTLFNQTFPIETFEAMLTFAGAFEPDKSDNTVHLVTHGDARIGLLLLELGPREAVIEWANRVVGEHPEHTFMVVTHAYLDGRNKLLGPDNPNSALNFGIEDATDAVTLWERLIDRHPNIQIVVSGHAGNAYDGTGLLVTENDRGATVHQIMANYQEFPPEEAGYLLVFSFEKNPSRVEMITYAPSRNVFGEDPDGYFTASFPY